MEGVFGFDYLQGSFLRTSRERANAPLVLTLAGLLEFGLTENRDKALVLDRLLWRKPTCFSYLNSIVALPRHSLIKELG